MIGLVIYSQLEIQLKALNLAGRSAFTYEIDDHLPYL